MQIITHLHITVLLRSVVILVGKKNPKYKTLNNFRRPSKFRDTFSRFCFSAFCWVPTCVSLPDKK